MCAIILDTRSCRCLMSVGPRFGTCCLSLIWNLEFSSGYNIFLKTCVPWIKSPLYQLHFPPTSLSPPARFMTIYRASHLFPAISSVHMHSTGRILLLPSASQMIQILETEYVNILGCQLQGIMIITTVSSTFYFTQYPLLLCKCSRISNNAFTFLLMKHNTPSAATLGAQKSAATRYFIHTQCVCVCVKRYLS